MQPGRRKTTRQLALEELAWYAEKLATARGEQGHTQFELMYLDLAIYLRELAGTAEGAPQPTLGQLRFLVP